MTRVSSRDGELSGEGNGDAWLREPYNKSHVQEQPEI